MKRLTVISLLVFSFLMVDAQLQRRDDIPVSIGVSEVFSYHIQNINLGVGINSCHTVAPIVENGELTNPNDNYQLNGPDTSQNLQYIELAKGMKLGLDIPFINNFGIGLGVQYNFDARDRMRYFVRFYHVFMDWDQKFHFSPAIRTGIKQLYTDDAPQDNVFIGIEADFDVRICSRLFVFVSAGFDYSRNRYLYLIEDSCLGTPARYDSEEKHDNFVFYGSYGLKFKMWGRGR
jgi:hypothetical protein